MDLLPGLLVIACVAFRYWTDLAMYEKRIRPY